VNGLVVSALLRSYLLNWLSLRQ